MEQEQTETIDHNLYSRQIGSYGVETMHKLIKLKVFLHGLRGVGIETAKNLILAGPNQVVIHDDSLVQTRDLGVNFYCREEDIGKRTRAEASLSQLKQLNPYVNVQVHSGEINEDFLSKFDVVVFTDYYNKQNLVKWNDFVRNRGAGFIYAGLLGLYGFTFVDFGPEFLVHDATGEDPKTAIISAISNENPGAVTTHEDKRHGLNDGDYVKFKEVEGMDELNGKTFQVKVLSPFGFSIDCDTTTFGKYERNGIAEQVKVPEKVPFKRLAESLEAPLTKKVSAFENPDLFKFGRPEHLHIAFNALLTFVETHGSLPRLNNSEDAEEVASLYEKINGTQLDIEGRVKVEQLDKDLAKNIALYADAQTSAHAAFWGGIVAQEVVKFTGKFMPIRQWLHYETFEALPQGEVNRKTTGCRYDDMIAIFGQAFQEKLMNMKIFLVGAGALGCELIKQMALTGMCCGPKGRLICTDDDNIEISNLNRQFLFRIEDVKKSKSETACRVGRTMNKDLNVEALKLRVAPENEQIFNDDFWESLDCVANAVDSVKARLYIDSRCVFYGKPLFESGTLGTKCNSQVIIPHQTQSYSDSQDPPEEAFAACTVKNFPYMIEHTIQWAREYFEGTFVQDPNEYHSYAENPNKYLEKLKQEYKQQPHFLRSRLETVEKIANYLRNVDHEACITLARQMFQDNFHNIIIDLLYTCPPDSKNENGQLFWSGLKRLPKILDYDPTDPTHADFIFATANLFAYVFKLEPLRDKAFVAQKAAKIALKEHQIKKLDVSEDKNNTGKVETLDNDEERIQELVQKLCNVNPANIRDVNTVEFEKDDDTNFHIDFIAAAANLRARNYNIEEMPRHKVKLVAGKIIPAIATATAMIVGLVGIEMFKYVGGKNIADFRNSFCNLAIPTWIISEPLPAIKNVDKDYDVVLAGPVKAIPQGWTSWDKIDIKGPKTIEEIIEEVKERYGVNLSIIAVGKAMVYSLGSKNAKDRLKMTPEEAYESINGEVYKPERKYVEITGSGETLDGVDASIPLIRYIKKL